MLAKAATITIDVLIDVDDMTPDISSEVIIDPTFSFLAQTPEILAHWVQGVADKIAQSGGRNV